MKIAKIATLLCTAAFIFPTTTNGAEEWIEKLKDIFKGKDPVITGKCEDIRELKYPGQKFWHTFEMTVSGKGQVVTPRCFGWFHTRKVINLVHQSKMVLVETITSSEQQLDEGIIETSYTIQRLDEELAQSKGEYNVGRISTKGLCAEIKTICEKWGSDKVEADPKVWIYCPGLKILNKFLLWTDEKIDSDGMVVVNQDTVKKNFPEMATVVSKFRKFLGTEIKATWKYGEGYTSIRFVNSDLDEDTKEAIAKLIYRTNPISVKEVLPEGKVSGDTWMIDSDTIGGIVFNLGLDFDDVRGRIKCRHLGAEMKDGEEVPDEYAMLKKQPLRLQALEIPNDRRNRIRLETRKGNAGKITIEFTPWGTFHIFDDHDSEGRHLYYLREAYMEGRLESQIKNTMSLMKDVEFQDADLKIVLNYVQIRSVPTRKKAE